MKGFDMRSFDVLGQRGARAFPSSALAAAALGALLAVHAGAAPAQAAQVAQGPMVQAITDSQAAFWVRTRIAQPTRIMLIAPDGTTSYSNSTTTSIFAADTASFVMTGLAPGSHYHYQVGVTDAQGTETWTGTYAFDTQATDPTRLDVAVVSDFALKLTASPALHTALQSRPNVLAVIGDLDHRDPANDDGGDQRNRQEAPEVLSDLRAMHQDTRDPTTPIGADFFNGLIGQPNTDVSQIPMVYAWDDHDFCANNQDQSCVFSRQAFTAWNEYYVAAPDNSQSNGCQQPGDFESLTYGTLVQLFFLDARSDRQNMKTQGTTGMLGTCQHQWLVNALHQSKALWKVVLSPVPINATIKPWDSWSMFPVERDALLQAIADVPNIVFVSGDVHTGGAIDDGTHSGRPEVSTPHANMPFTWVNTFCRVEDKGTVLVSRPGSWTIGGLYDPILGYEPLQCLGKYFKDNMKTDGIPVPVYPLDGRKNPGYTWITATKTSLELTVHGIDGSVKQGYTADGNATQMVLSMTPGAVRKGPGAAGK
jgi:alkaline phosphatase D